MPNNSAVYLTCSWEEAGDIFESNQGNIEAIAEAHETRAFYRRIDVERSSKKRRLIGHEANRPTVHPRKSYDNVFRVVLVHFEKISVVNYGADDVLYVVGKIRLRGHNGVECRIRAVGGIGASLSRRIVEIVRWNETEQLAQPGQALRIVMR